MERMIMRATAIFEGHVQGVGFRMQTKRVAQGFEVAGTVQNLADGNVKIVAEGVPAEVDAFLEAVSQELKSFIKNVQIQRENGVPASASDFKII